jgi:hypothetical protein
MISPSLVYSISPGSDDCASPDQRAFGTTPPPDTAIAVVASSAFMVVGVLLDCYFLRSMSASLLIWHWHGLFLNCLFIGARLIFSPAEWLKV